MMTWNHRIVDCSEGEDQYFSIKEVHYNEDGSPAAHTDAWLGSEYLNQVEHNLFRIMDDLRRNPDVLKLSDFVGFKHDHDI